MFLCIKFLCTGVLLILCLALYRISGDSCILRETSRYPWVVKIWKTAPGMIVGHGALLSQDKVLSSCNAFFNLSPDLNNERYEMIAHDYRGVDRRIPFCTDSRFADSITIHPECDPSSSSQLHDFAIWNLERPFQVVGKPFLTPLLLEKELIEWKISEIGLEDYCQMVFTNDPTKRDSIGAVKIVGRCGFQDYSTLDVCDGENCTKQLADGLLCFYSQKRSVDSTWKVRQPSETADFVEGSVVLCYGTPVGIASRTFYSNEYKVYRMFSNFVNNLDFLRTSWTTARTVTTTPMTTTPMKSPTTTTPRKTTTEGGRTPDTGTTTRLTTPINCACPPYKESIHIFDGEASIHGDQLWHNLIATLGIHSILHSFGRS